MATSSFSKNFVLDPKKMSKECKTHLFDNVFHNEKQRTRFKSHVASKKDIAKLINNISK